MSIRAIVVLPVLMVSTLLWGCNGPTKEGIKARSEAAQRMNFVSAQIHFDQARQAFNTGQFDRAIREITYAIQVNPKSAEYDVLKGRIYLETHKLEAAIESFNNALTKDAKLAEAHYYSGIVYQRWSNDEKAYESYSKAHEIEPANAQYMLASAESLITLGKIDEAWEMTELKLKYFEHNAALRQLQGQIALLQGDPARAAELLGQARLLNPDDDLLLEELMWAQFAGQKYGACHESAKQLQGRLKEERPDLFHLEARCLALMNRGPEAREHYLKLSRLRPADPTVWSELGALTWDLGDYRGLLECSTRLISLAPDRHEGYMLRGIYERHQGKSDDARKYFELASQRASDTALPHMLLGQLMEEAGDRSGAAVAYNKALSAEPDSDQARDLLSRLNGVAAVPTNAPAN
ncbi:MAG: tetratricopeptide repeat protein [Phycisphaerales bacterium]|nr:tetratricopeptide repeat protein [Phycisphaerales bacterium]MCI0630720.1 tetratricopeptide repeat protein [Phycisphaerales bacterium]MCI0676550.1 tetratricopeptide repeat protein [Phycisphaerales bacterium]